MTDTSYEKKRIKELKALGFTSEETKEYMETYKKKLSKQKSIDTTKSSNLSGGEMTLLFIVIVLITIPIVVYSKWGGDGIWFLGMIFLVLIPTQKNVKDMAIGAIGYTLWKNRDRIIDKADRWLDD
jgi:DNA-binding transcriptional MerR regulator